MDLKFKSFLLRRLNPSDSIHPLPYRRIRKEWISYQKRRWGPLFLLAMRFIPSYNLVYRNKVTPITMMSIIFKVNLREVPQSLIVGDAMWIDSIRYLGNK